jgi:hypothetical protein
MTRNLPILLAVAFLAPVYSQKASNPLVGSWNFDMPGGSRAVWLGVKEIAGGLEIWYQPTGGNVYQVKNFKADGRHLSLALSAASANRPAFELGSRMSTATRSLPFRSAATLRPR